MKHSSPRFSSFRFRDGGFKGTAARLGGTVSLPGVTEVPAGHCRATGCPGKAQGAEVLPQLWGFVPQSSTCQGSGAALGQPLWPAQEAEKSRMLLDVAKPRRFPFCSVVKGKSPGKGTWRCGPPKGACRVWPPRGGMRFWGFLCPAAVPCQGECNKSV